MDKKDPRRQVGLLTFDKLDPLPAHHYFATKPEAWLYLEDGRSLHITAASGNLYMPDRQKEPESGTLAGGVLGRLYEALPDGAKVDEAKDKPFMTFKTESFTFDSTLGKGSTKDIVTVNSEIVDFTGHGLDVNFNQVRERLEMCRVGPGDNVAVFHTEHARRKPAEKKPVPKTSTAAATTPIAPSTTPAAAPQEASAKPPESKAPRETLYRIDVEQAVDVTQGGRRLDADLLQIWARLIGNKLPDGAIAEIKGPSAAAEPPARPAPPASAAPVTPAPVVAAPTVAPEPASKDITLRWSGPCMITPLDVATPELKSEHVSARFTAQQTGAVTMSDREKGSEGRAGSIEYGATTGKLLLSGQDANTPKLTFANLGTIQTARIEGDLVRGLVHIPAAGRMKDDKRDGLATWSRQADFLLTVRDGQLTGGLTRALLDGEARLNSKDGSGSADSLRADFDSTAGNANVLSRLILTGHALAELGEEQRIAADTLDTTFAPPVTKGGDPEPRVVTATGNVEARKKDSTIRAAWLEARLARTPKGIVDVISASARGEVKFTRDQDQVEARADEMNADLGWDSAGVRRQVVDLLGKRAVVSREGKSSIVGTQLRLDGVVHSVEAFGAGTFDTNDPGKAVVTARWSESMVYNDTSGNLDAVGDVYAVSTPDDLRRDEIEAWRVKLTLRPRSEGAQPGASSVLRAEAIGSMLDHEGGTTAKVTSERFVAEPAAPGGRRREQVQYVEGPRVLADDEKGTADVPGAGKLIYVDNAADRGPDSNGQSALARGDARGDTLFTWSGSLHMDRATGKADMHQGVRMTHRSLTDRLITNVDCDHLTAVGAGKGIGTSAPDSKASFQSATATGAVYVTQGPEDDGSRKPRKELVADRVDYDAVKQTLEAAAAKEGLVSYLDPARGAPMSAKALSWDLASGRIELHNVSAVVAPK
jgi:lipopolysaccharide export system protein LptA